MNTVSFGSTFKIKDNDSNDISERKMVNFCEDNDLEYASKIEVIKSSKSFFEEPIYNISTSIIAPDEKDGLVEAYLANKGIQFKKLSTKDLLNPSKIESRIKDATGDKRLVKVDIEKLNQLLPNQSNNIAHCERDYRNYYKDSVESMIKTGDKIPATTMYINPTGESVEDVVDYINKFGADRLNDDQLVLMFTQTSDDPDYCMFFGMKDLGMDKVPVYVNKDTYTIGNALGIFSK